MFGNPPNPQELFDAIHVLAATPPSPTPALRHAIYDADLDKMISGNQNNKKNADPDPNAYANPHPHPLTPTHLPFSLTLTQP